MSACLVLVRHGQSEWNLAGRMQGHAGPGLSAAGGVQAETTAAHLTTTLGSVDRIVRSDLPRVTETATPAEAAFGIRAQVDPRLREIDVGTWAGLTWPEVEATDAATLAAWHGGRDVRRGGGETFAELRSRVWAVVSELAVATGTVLVFTHGGPIRVAVAEALGLPPLGERLLAPVDNCSLTELSLGATSVVVSYNRADHLLAVPAPAQSGWLASDLRGRRRS